MEHENPEEHSPERASKTTRPERILKKPCDVSELSTNDILTKTKWSQKEIKALLEGFKKYGVTRISSILELLPNRNYDQVKHLLWKISRDAYKVRSQEREVESFIKKDESEDSAIGVKLVSTERQNNPFKPFREQAAITKSLLFLENLEPHLSPESNNAINFKQLYNAVYMAMKGYPLPQMNEATLKFFCESFQNLLKAASGNVIESFPTEDHHALERLSENDLINPLSLHFESLKARIHLGSSNNEKSLGNIRNWVSPSDWKCL